MLLLLTSAYAFAESYRPDHPIPDKTMQAYSAPASIELNGGWDLFATSSLIYWHVSQDYMDVGYTAQFEPAGPQYGPRTGVVTPEFDYKPGFKVGVGAESVFDHWSALFAYTWLHQKTTSSTGALPGSVSTGQKIYETNNWYFLREQAAEIKTEWKMDLDQFDLCFTYPFFEGPLAVIYHHGGFRSVLLHQIYSLDAVIAQHLNGPTINSQNQMKSWSIGPMVGIGAHSLYKWGVRFEGFTKLSLLYTRYTKISHQENDPGAPIISTSGPYGCIRPVSEFGLGAGWGSYLGDGRFHVDLAARYDFTIMWKQNMMRPRSETFLATLYGNLYLHGLTVDASFNF